ncbi:MAG: DUF3833 domain-containing protein [Verrucomicrobiota bacterium]|nr:DUF3833 domain-containing protein [Verrucomicrobiota bacterium]
MKPSEFAAQQPTFDPARFFTGRTRSSGVLENRGGSPTQRVTTETRGQWNGDTLKLEQDLAFSGGKRQHRSWSMRRIDAHHFEATANDIIGTIRGEAYGNVFHWSFTVALSPGNPLSHVRMTQWMYFQPDRRTMLNHSTIRKAGIVVAQVTEQFSRETK